MTLDEIKVRHKYFDNSTGPRQIMEIVHLARERHSDRAKLIEWLDRAMPTLKWAAGDRTMNNTKLDALLREIEGETK